jgi:peptidoglycan/xylan/chitin deacetylase (PgdA/CDA1 family)
LEIVPLETLLEPSPGRRVAITFDDGYADVATYAVPVLEAAGARATLFVIAAMLGGGQEFWWDRLRHLVFDAPSTMEHLEVVIAGSKLWVDLRSHAARERAYQAILRVRQHPTDEVSRVLDQVRSGLGTQWACDAHKSLTAEELKNLLANGSIDVGSHSMTHRVVAGLSSEERQVEIIESRLLLEHVLGRSVKAFAYPYGDLDDEAVRLVQAAGYGLACTILLGNVTERSDRFRLPRYGVGDWSRDQFAWQLSRWLDE